MSIHKWHLLAAGWRSRSFSILEIARYGCRRSRDVFGEVENSLGPCRKPKSTIYGWKLTNYIVPMEEQNNHIIIFEVKTRRLQGLQNE